MERQKVVILDFGSQTTQLIARRLREIGAYCEILPCHVDLKHVIEASPKAIILSGGPASVDAPNAPQLMHGILELKIPVLGICYGMQLLAKELGGRVQRAEKREFGRAPIEITTSSPLFTDVPSRIDVWMSHGDQIDTLPPAFVGVARSETCPYVAIENQERGFYGLQFHPEVFHSQFGKEILTNFVSKIAGLELSWKMSTFLEDEVVNIRQTVGEKHVLMALSGGVDSSVAAALIHRAIGKQLHCVYVNHGLQRKGEIDEIKSIFQEVLHLDLRIVDASAEFLNALAGITDPEQKRKVVGRIFIDVFEREAAKFSDIAFLGQGTLYPDVVESVSAHGGPSAVIKSHHNVGGLPERMHLKLIEPLRQLFKDEVRILGEQLGLPKRLVNRQPFPGPGLSIRIIGEVTPLRCELLRKADAIVRQEIDTARGQAKLGPNLWQWFAVLLPVRTVGVMGDGRTYGETIAVRCVESTDGMTADFAHIPYPLLATISNRIINEVQGISRVVYDISSKPPSTIEWE
jgi:GMP synthase (glutamine-hydrolysing)